MLTLHGTLCGALTGGSAADAVVQKRAPLSPPLERIWVAFLRQGTFHAVFGAALFSQHALRVTRFYNHIKIITRASSPFNRTFRLPPQWLWSCLLLVFPVHSLISQINLRKNPLLNSRHTFPFVLSNSLRKWGFLCSPREFLVKQYFIQKWHFLWRTWPGRIN